MTKRIFPIILLGAAQIFPSSLARAVETAAPKAVIAQPLIADNQQFLALNGTTDNQGKGKNTYQNCFRAKVAAKELIFPLAQAYSSWNESENQTEFSNPATYRAAVSINKGPWMQLTWGGQKSKECPFREVILNDPLPVEVKPGDSILLRTEISVPPGGKWGLGAQARTSDSDFNWTEGGTNSEADVLLADHANFKPQEGLFTHTAQGVFGKPVGAPEFHPALILGDSISPYVFKAVDAIGQAAPVAYFGQPAEPGGRFWQAGQVRQKLLGGYEVLLYEYGVNDLRAKRTFEEIKSDAVNTWAAFRTAGGKHLIVFTATPLSQSTDKWKTEAGQTPDFEPETRARWNDFLRALNRKELGIGVFVIDTAALFENKQNNSLWKPTAEGLPMTDDGVHPNEVGYKMIEVQLGPKIRQMVQQKHTAAQ